MNKRYWTLRNVYEAQLPPEFLISTNQKWIVVHKVTCKFKQTLIGDIEFHSDLIKRGADLDSFVCFVNEVRGKYLKKFEWESASRYLHFWFTDMFGNKIEPEAFVIEFNLIY